ncbi:MAG: extracellular solute-binding protein [Clostridia bacterium]|nr:extracellular solute-binding protein [Clostridia bacterium]
MKKAVNKTILILLTLTLILTLLTGCNDQKPVDVDPTTDTPTVAPTDTPPEDESILTDAGYPIVKEKITMYGARPDNQRVDYMENKQAEWLEELTGIHIEMATYASDVWQEKLSVMLAGEDYPEFLYMADALRETQTLYGRDSGILLDLKPYIESGVMANFKTFTDANEDIYRIACIDEGLYALPFLMNGLNEPHLIINKDWLNALGLEMPTTLEEYTNVLRAFKTGDPNGNGKDDEIPITSGYNIYWLRPQATNFGLQAISLLEDDDGKVYHAVQTQNYKDYLKWISECYEEGLIDSRVPTGVINDEAIAADMRENLVGVIYCAYASLAVNEPLEYTGFIPVPYGDNPTGVWPASITMVQGTFCVTDACQYPEAILRWIDWQYSEEGNLMYNYGKEGETFELSADGSWSWLNIPEGMTATEYQNTFSIQGMHYFPGIYSSWALEHSALEEDKITLRNREQLLPITKKTIGEFSYTTEENDRVSVILTELNTHIDSYEAKVLAGENDLEATWQKFQDQLIDIGIEEYISITQGALDRFYGN